MRRGRRQARHAGRQTRQDQLKLYREHSAALALTCKQLVEARQSEDRVNELERKLEVLGEEKARSEGEKARAEGEKAKAKEEKDRAKEEKARAEEEKSIAEHVAEVKLENALIEKGRLEGKCSEVKERLTVYTLELQAARER